VSAPVRVSLVPAATIFAWPVIAVREGGRFVDLSDGTSWEVAPADRPVAAAWEEGQPVTVGRIGAPTAGAADSPTDGFEHSLTNAEAYRNGQAMRTVAVRFAGRAP
jgi:hypothetical protein